jgi:signal transduction histidine kinase
MATKRPSSEADILASLAVEAREQLVNTGRALHDDVAPLLAGAGLWLSTAPADPAIKEAMSALDQAMERVREISQQLNQSPVDRMGLQNALLELQQQYPEVDVTYSATAKLSRPAASAIYDAAVQAVRAALMAKAERIQIEVTGDAGLRIRIRDNGRPSGRARTLSLAMKLAQAAGLAMTVTTKNATIVSILYAVRRSTGR